MPKKLPDLARLTHFLESVERETSKEDFLHLPEKHRYKVRKGQNVEKKQKEVAKEQQWRGIGHKHRAGGKRLEKTRDKPDKDVQ